MIKKKDLLAAIDELTIQVVDQGTKIRELEIALDKLTPKKSKNALRQPRDGSGKFAKKK